MRKEMFLFMEVKVKVTPLNIHNNELPLISL